MEESENTSIQVQTRAITDYDEYTLYLHQVTVDTNLLYYGYIRIPPKRGITLEPFGWASINLCPTHLLIIGIMCSEFHLDDLKTVGGV